MDLNDAALFAEVVAHGSFTAAADALGMQVSTVSRRVARLERDLDVRLLHRTTRTLSLTDAGRVYHDVAITGLARLDAAAAAVQELQQEPRGTIRVTSVTGMQRFAWELLDGFMHAHPHVRVVLDLTEQLVDLVGGGYDVALRTGHMPDSSLISCQVAETQSVLYAAPHYLAARGEPETPDGLREHTCILFGRAPTGQWTLSRGADIAVVPVEGRLASTSMATNFHACLAGLGIGYLPTVLGEPHIAAGRLVRVLPTWAGAVNGLYVVYPSKRQLSPSVRAFISHVAHAAPSAIARSVQA